MTQKPDAVELKPKPVTGRYALGKIFPVKHLHGLSPIEDWIHHSQYLEQELATLTAKRDALLREVEAARRATQIGLDTLIAMRDADYRGNRPTSAFVAKHAVDAINKALKGDSKP